MSTRLLRSLWHAFGWSHNLPIRAPNMMAPHQMPVPVAYDKDVGSSEVHRSNNGFRGSVLV